MSTLIRNFIPFLSFFLILTLLNAAALAACKKNEKSKRPFVVCDEIVIVYLPCNFSWALFVRNQRFPFFTQPSWKNERQICRIKHKLGIMDQDLNAKRRLYLRHHTGFKISQIYFYCMTTFYRFVLCSMLCTHSFLRKGNEQQKKEKTNVALLSVETYARADMLSPNL